MKSVQQASILLHVFGTVPLPDPIPSFFFPAFLLFRFLFAFRFGAWLHMRTAATSIGQRTMNINCIHLRTFLRLYVFGGGWVWGGGGVGGVSGGVGSWRGGEVGWGVGDGGGWGDNYITAM